MEATHHSEYHVPDIPGAGPDRRAPGSASPAALFALVSLFLGMDLASDLARGERGVHIVGESVGIALSIAGLTLIWRYLTRSLARARELATAIDRDRDDLEEWRARPMRMLHGLGEQLEQHFTDLDLSAGEREVALLLLTGLSPREIAGARGTREHIVRRQADAVYRKANVTGQPELAAYFLEALLLPLASPVARVPHASDSERR